MRRFIVSLTAFVCLFLCACGNMRDYSGTMPDTQVPVESMIPDPEDGYVTDRDGVIEDNEKDAQHTAAPDITKNP